MTESHVILIGLGPLIEKQLRFMTLISKALTRFPILLHTKLLQLTKPPNTYSHNTPHPHTAEPAHCSHFPCSQDGMLVSLQLYK